MSDPGERFVSRIREDTSGCLIWTGHLDKDGYGHFKMAGVRTTAHRTAWLLAGREIPPGMKILHKCDTPACVRVEHLFLGTHADNMRDMAAKGRGRSGKSKSGFPFGARLHQGRWMSQASLRGTVRYLGMYDTWQEASAIARYHRNLELFPDLGVN